MAYSTVDYSSRDRYRTPQPGQTISPPQGSTGNTTVMPYLQQPTGGTPRFQPGAGMTPEEPRVPGTTMRIPGMTAVTGAMTPQPPQPEPGMRIGDWSLTERAAPGGGMQQEPPAAAAVGAVQSAQNAQATQHPLAGLAERIGQWLQNPSGFNLPEVQAARDMLKRELQSDIDVDAAKRGVSFGTAPTAIFGREMGRIDTELATRAAQQQAEDLARAVGAAQRFGEAQQYGDLSRTGLALEGARLGEMGAPDMNQILMALGGMGMAPGAQANPAIYQLLGQLFG